MTCPICHHASAACVCVRNVAVATDSPRPDGRCPRCLNIPCTCSGATTAPGYRDPRVLVPLSSEPLLDPGDCPACRQPYDAQERAEERLEGHRRDAERLRAELAALVTLGEKLRTDSERASGQALDLSRDWGRVAKLLDDAGVPRSAPLPCRPWRQDDRVAWVLEQLSLRNDLVDRLEEELSQARVDLAQLQQQHARLQLSACRVVSGGPAHG